MPSCKPARPILSTEAQLDQIIADLEQHNEKVRNLILTTSLSRRKPARHAAPSSSRPSETKSIITCLQSAHNPSCPAPTSSNNNPHPPPLPPTTSRSTAVSLARETVERLRVFDDQAGITMAPLYMERERRRREVERRRLEVPREFGVGVGVGGEGEKGEVKGAGGMVDRSRDPRLKRG
ncbi:MAG: hypothetical protein LQ339_003255 [Xanthoria mediterranea]|nr:MAG: hypothetical protein LQ339_003255 [Xanthoria mediterranea]